MQGKNGQKSGVYTTFIAARPRILSPFLTPQATQIFFQQTARVGWTHQQMPCLPDGRAC